MNHQSRFLRDLGPWFINTLFINQFSKHWELCTAPSVDACSPLMAPASVFIGDIQVTVVADPDICTAWAILNPFKAFVKDFNTTILANVLGPVHCDFSSNSIEGEEQPNEWLQIQNFRALSKNLASLLMN
jgi:hypothetical protein